MPKILVFEDDPNISDMYKLKLQHNGFDVRVINAPGDVVQQVKDFAPDLLILDILLPGMSGLSVLEEVRKDEALTTLPVVMLTNLSENAMVKRAKELGALGFYIKANFTPGEIVDIIKKIIAGESTEGTERME
ncbi:response regulator [Patescibacteria group bacterium]|jgi:DNA-binding response OmpR family regulator|nr:response regulator [Patescibacteria group bacterium]